MRYCLTLLCLVPLAVSAGTRYVVTSHGLVPPETTSSQAAFFVEDGRVRAGGSTARIVYLFSDSKAFIVDNQTQSVQVATSALVDQAAGRMDERVRLLRDTAASQPADRRAVLEKMATDLQALNDSRRLPVPRVFHRTERSDRVDGRACRIWEATEWDVKRFEFCVAPRSAVPGSGEILAGMQALSHYWQGSVFALGVKLGNADWWPGIAGLGGLPLRVREFKDGSPIAETTLTQIADGVPGAAAFAIPASYSRTEVALIP